MSHLNSMKKLRRSPPPCSDLSSSERGARFRQSVQDARRGNQTPVFTVTNTHKAAVSRGTALPCREDLDCEEQELIVKADREIESESYHDMMHTRSAFLSTAGNRVQQNHAMCTLVVAARQFQVEKRQRQQQATKRTLSTTGAAAGLDRQRESNGATTVAVAATAAAEQSNKKNNEAFMGPQLVKSTVTKMLLHDVNLLIFNKKGIDRFDNVKQQLNGLHLWH